MKQVIQKNKASEVITRCLTIIYSYLHEKDIPNTDFFYANKKLYLYYEFERLNNIKATYDKLKAVTPIEFNYTDDLDMIIDIIFGDSDKKNLISLLIPASEKVYFNELNEKEMISFYRNQFNLQSKRKRHDQLIKYIFRGNNWEEYLCARIDKDVELKVKNHHWWYGYNYNYNSKKLRKLETYIKTNYYQIKAFLYLENYKTYLKSKNIKDKVSFIKLGTINN